MTSPSTIPGEIFSRLEIGDTQETPITISGRFAAYLHNLKIEIAEAKLATKFNPDKQLQFVQEEATKTGQLQLIEEILNNVRISE